MHLLAGRPDEARLLATQALKAEPFLAAHWVLVTLTLHNKDYDETLRLLKQIDKGFQMQWNDLATQPDYAGFVASPQYQQWREYLEKK